jgi:hypothetical protein
VRRQQLILALAACGLVRCFPTYSFVDDVPDGGPPDVPRFCTTLDPAPAKCEDFEEPDAALSQWRVERDCKDAVVESQRGSARAGAFALRTSIPSLPAKTGCSASIRQLSFDPWRRARLELDMKAHVEARGTSGPSVAQLHFGPSGAPHCAAELFLLGQGRSLQLITIEGSSREGETIPFEHDRWYHFDLEIVPGANETGSITIGYAREGEARKTTSRRASCIAKPPTPTMNFRVGFVRYPDDYVSPGIEADYDNVFIRFP